MSSIFTVSQITEAISSNIEQAFPFVWVQGEVANLSRPANGHMYFTLRDEFASLSAVWFKSSQKPGENFDPLTGEVYEGGPRPSLALSLQNGMDVICAGRMGVYAARGAYQLKVELAQDAGVSRFQLEFERLKAKLSGLGYFSLERKRPLPKYAGRVAVITSPQGAAVHDFLRIARGRGFGAEIRIYPVPVQGEEAPLKVATALAEVSSQGWAEVVVLVRGGGSLEDLWAFSTEQVAEAVFSSAVPVLAGIGHETDISLADLTADVRAATPSHAAQLLWPDRSELASELGVVYRSLLRAEQACLREKEDRLRSLAQELGWRSPAKLLAGWRERLDTACERMYLAVRRVPQMHWPRLQRLAERLMIAPGRLPRRLRELESLQQRLDFSGRQLLLAAEHSLERLSLKLGSLDPHEPLERGYALVRKQDGSFVRETGMAGQGEELHIMVKDGEIPVVVKGDG